MLVDPCKTYRVTAIFGANLLRTLEASEEFVQPLRLLLKVGSLQLVYVVGYQWMSLWCCSHATLFYGSDQLLRHRGLYSSVSTRYDPWFHGICTPLQTTQPRQCCPPRRPALSIVRPTPISPWSSVPPSPHGSSYGLGTAGLSSPFHDRSFLAAHFVPLIVALPVATRPDGLPLVRGPSPSESNTDECPETASAPFPREKIENQPGRPLERSSRSPNEGMTASPAPGEATAPRVRCGARRRADLASDRRRTRLRHQVGSMNLLQSPIDVRR